MNQCLNCGQGNHYESHFCRFCGTRMSQPQAIQTPAQTYEENPPRPYSWKTDEFQVPANQARKTGQINQVQPFAQPRPNYQPPAFRAPQPQASPMMNYRYQCPRCAAQVQPIYERKISTAGWIVFAVLLVMFFPLFWIGFLIKEDVRTCPICQTKI